MGNHINVALILKGQSMDARILIKIEVRKLIRKFDKIFGSDSLCHKYQLHVVNKGLVLDKGRWLAHYLVTAGNMIEVEGIN